MTDSVNLLAHLRALRASAADAHQAAALDAAITQLADAEGAVPRTHTQTLGDDAHAGAAVAGDIRGDLVAPLFTTNASGNYIASVLNLYQHAPAAPAIDYAAALRRYLSYLYRHYATVDLRGIDDRPLDMPLSELYVALTLHEPAPDDQRGPGALRGFMEKIRATFVRHADDAEVHAAPRAVDWAAALRHPRLAIVGAPGSGKTTLLHYTTVRLCEVLARDDRAPLVALGLDADDAPAAPPVPLFLPLRELGASLREVGRREASGANPLLLLDCLANLYARCDLALPPDFFTRLCESGRAILLLDGLDEVVQTSDRVEVSAIVRHVAQRYPACRIIVTARVAAYQGDAQIGAGFRICTVDDLDADQQQRFIANWSRSLHRRLYGLHDAELAQAAQRYTDRLWGALMQHERVRLLATNPLLLTVVAVIFYNKYELPEDRAALYEECVEVLLRGGRGKADRPTQERREYAGQRDLSMGLEPKRDLLAAVAYQMHQRGEQGLVISRAELVRTVAGILVGRGGDAHTIAETFVAELPVHIGLLDEREPDRYRFSHLSFQEFLAARHIAEAPDDRWGEVLAHVEESWWREVIVLCAGHLSQARCWRFLEQLSGCGQTPMAQAQAMLLAARALTELERFKGEGPIRAQLRERALALFENRTTPAAARVVCGQALALVGDPRPGVCDLARMPFVPFDAASFVIGSTPVEAEAAGRAWERYWLDQGDKETAKRARRWPEDEINDQTVTLPAFALARYPVTNAQYQCFIDAGGYDPSAPWWDEAARAWLARDDAATEGLKDWQRRAHKDSPEFWDNARFGRALPNHPVVGVSWYEATAFARWLTLHLNNGFRYRLPSEAEWEYAARGVARRTYAWGHEEPDAERANFNRIYEGTSAVGCFVAGATPEGLLDMTGNVEEWTRSAYRAYPYDPDDGREADGDVASKHFTFRGGGWDNRPSYLRASNRYGSPPVNLILNLGFRLARYSSV